ncbi:MAG: hypothetical protein V6Z81_06535 [Parvularculales bacterium]
MSFNGKASNVSAESVKVSAESGNIFEVIVLEPFTACDFGKDSDGVKFFNFRALNTPEAQAWRKEQAEKEDKEK